MLSRRPSVNLPFAKQTSAYAPLPPVVASCLHSSWEIKSGRMAHACEENLMRCFKFLSLCQPAAPKVKKLVPAGFFTFWPAGRFFHSDPYLERGRQFSFTLAGPARLGCGRTKTTSDGRILAAQELDLAAAAVEGLCTPSPFIGSVALLR